MRRHKSRSGVNSYRALNQKGVKQTNVKQGFVTIYSQELLIETYTESSEPNRNSRTLTDNYSLKNAICSIDRLTSDVLCFKAFSQNC
jgi:hypothetical protein